MSFAVVTWKRKGSSPLPTEQVEVLKLQKLVVEGEVGVGSDCAMQYQQQMWYGKIHSLHGKFPSLCVSLHNNPIKYNLQDLLAISYCGN